jgi:hypothetical protein
MNGIASASPIIPIASGSCVMVVQLIPDYDLLDKESNGYKNLRRDNNGTPRNAERERSCFMGGGFIGI